MGSLGDVVRALCLPGAIKAHWPQARITWLVEPSCAELVAAHPLVDDTIIFDRPKKIKGLWALYRKLSEEAFDLSLDLQRHLKSGFFGLLAGAPRRIGFHRGNAKELNWLFTTERIGWEGEQLPKLDHYLKFLQYLEIPIPSRLDFGLGPALADRRPGGLKPPYCALVLGSSWESKEWFVGGYLRLMRLLLRESGLQLVLIDVPAKQEQARQLETDLRSLRVLNLVGRTGLRELAAVLQGAELAIGPDCGSGHLAAAVGTPYISLFGPTSARRTAPHGNLSLVCEAELACQPCYQRACPHKDRRCMREIDPDRVFALALETLGRRS